MRILRFLAVLLCLVHLARGQLNNPVAFTGNVTDCTGRPFMGQFRQMQFTPMSTPQFIGGNTIWPQNVTVPIATNGAVSGGLVGGLYWVGLGLQQHVMKVLVPPNDTNVWTLNQLAMLATNALEYIWLGDVNVTVSGATLPPGILTNNEPGVSLPNLTATGSMIITNVIRPSVQMFNGTGQSGVFR